MKLDLFKIDDFIRLNNCPEVTNPIFFQYNKTATPDGLLSYELFGYSEEDRKNIFGYIDLNGYYIHPIVYSMIGSRMGTLKYIVNGEKYAVILGGKITVVDENAEGAGTGIDFLYDNFHKIDWIKSDEEEEMNSIDKKTRLKFLKSLSKDEFFISKWLVIPPYYREESAENRSLGDNINALYKSLILSTKNMKSGFSFDIFGTQTKKRIQDLLNHIYNVTMGPITGKSLDMESMEMRGNAKNSLIKRHMLGKNLDYGAISVIVAPQISNAKSPKESPVPFGYTGVTLINCVGIFKPFFIHGVGNFLNRRLNAFIDEYGRNIKRIDRNQFSNTNVDKLLTKFIKSPIDRFKPITIDFTGNDDEEYKMNIVINEFYTKTDAKLHQNGLTRPMTITDLIYMTAVDVLKNKHVIVTRYPVFDSRNIYPSGIKILSTIKTRKIYMNLLDDDKFENEPIEYETYPFIDIYPYLDEEELAIYPKKAPKEFYEFMGPCILGNVVLPSIGGDYDGDTVSIRGLFSNEANDEAAKLIKATSNLLTVDGKLLRSLSALGKDCIVTFYQLTKD